MKGIRFDEHTRQVQGAHQLFLRGSLTGGMGVVVFLSQSDTKSADIDRDLSDRNAVGRRPSTSFHQRPNDPNPLLRLGFG